MPVQYLRSLTSPERTHRANSSLGVGLAFIAGAVNAGGFLAIGYYTSHMSGIVASISDNIMIGNFHFVLAGMACLIAFLGGAATSALLINWGRQRQTASEYAFPLALEAVLLLCFGLLGANINRHLVLFVPATVTLLCYIMGLQNAIITKISRSEIRTTHVTGLVTDIGIELGKALYWNRKSVPCTNKPVAANPEKLKLLTRLLVSFFLGGLTGAIGFKVFGFVTTVPLACLLAILAAVPLMDDIRIGMRGRGL